ncbi:MAG: exodeoxyribonuclease III [Eggerthellaceae bacterium]|nr:exodeoxyribonuclease III [Eggerthellaceae bacterium]
MRFISWNVNGLRAILKKDFEEIFDQFGADVFAIQETKLQAGQVEIGFDGYKIYWSYAERKGYSGTAVFTRMTPIRVLHGLGNDYLDNEGRVLALEFDDFWFVDVYTPNSQDQLARLPHRLQWDEAFRDFCTGLQEGTLPGGVLVEYPRQLEEKGQPADDSNICADISGLPRTEDGETSVPKPIVVCGDFNVAHEEIDLKEPEKYAGSTGFSDEERSDFSALLDAGLIDTFRYLHPDLAEVYSWWSYRMRARQQNNGWRLDYFLVSKSLEDKITSATIYTEVMGSDHCPIGLELDID